MVLTIIPSYYPICNGSQQDFWLLAFQPALRIKSDWIEWLASLACCLELQPAIPSSIYIIDTAPWDLHLPTKRSKGAFIIYERGGGGMGEILKISIFFRIPTQNI